MSDGFENFVLSQKSLFDEKCEEKIFNWSEFDLSYNKTSWKLSDRVFIVKSENSAEIIIAGHDVKLSKKSERLVIKEGENVFYEIPLFRISHIIIQSRGVSLSSDLIEESVKKGIVLLFLTYSGKPYASISSPSLNAVIKTKREQIKSYYDTRGVVFSKKIVEGKISNQISTLKYAIKNLQAEIKEKINKNINEIESYLPMLDKIKGEKIDDVRNELLWIEAVCGKKYWDCFRNIISDYCEFSRRQYHGKIGPVNSLLNYGYGMLYSVVWSAVMNAGLEPFAGFLHVDEPGRPSMILDMVEEFRAPVIDRTVIAFVRLGKKIEIENELLSLSTRKEFSEKVLERLEAFEYFEGSRFKIKSIIQIQTRRAASFFREGTEYKPFSFKW